MAKVRLSGIGKKFGTVEVIRDLNLEVGEGGILCPAGAFRLREIHAAQDDRRARGCDRGKN